MPSHGFVARSFPNDTSLEIPYRPVPEQNLAEKCNVDLEHREKSHSCTGVAVQISPTRHTFRIRHPIHFPRAFPVDISFFLLLSLSVLLVQLCFR